MAEIIKMPRLSDTMTDGVVAKWHKKIGDSIKEGDLLADIETDKATMEFESFQEGVLLYIGVQENEKAQVDSILAIIGEKGEDFSSMLDNEVHNTSKDTHDLLQDTKDLSTSIDVVKEVVQPPSPIITSSQTKSILKISPLAKKIAKEKNIDLSIIQGSGDGGRIIKRDLENIGEFKHTSNTTSYTLESKQEPISQMRQTIANRLSESKFSAPHFYLNMEICMDNLIQSRQDLKDKHDVKISFNDILVKAVSMAIRKHPIINSSWLESHIAFHKDINIGVAVSVENGLIVPVIKSADIKSLSDIATETNLLIQKAKDNKLQPTDWEGNTFTISNLGMFGIDDFTAIINPPDACILAVGAIKERPVVRSGGIVAASIMRLTLSCDHRVVDGVEGAKFLNTLKNMLESPLMMFC